MRLRFVGLAMIGLMQAASAGELGLPWLRGAADLGPGTPNAAPALPGEPVVRPHLPPPPPENITFEAGARYWFSTGRLTKELYDDPRRSPALNSRLTYDGLTAGSFEGYGRFDLTYGTFVKGTIGFAGLNNGTLQDEDLPPNTLPYSSTSSPLGSGRLNYGTIDLGQIVVTSGRARGSVILGYGHLTETMNAFGCTQTAANPLICMPAISTGTLAITEETHWDFARLGVMGEYKLLDRLTLSGEAAWLPYVQVSGLDTHWLRLGATLNSLSGPISQSGSGTGVQLESILSYQVTDCFNLGIGARYWYLQTRGSADLEQRIIGLNSPVSQPLNFTTWRYGGFAQGAYRFGPF
jgi:hypothetical protein